MTFPGLPVEMTPAVIESPAVRERRSSGEQQGGSKNELPDHERPHEG
jgi:hypothetical protein